MTPRNLRVLVALLAVVALGLVVDRGQGPARSAAFPVKAFAMPEAPPADALSASWYCALGVAKPAGVPAGQVVIANPTPSPVTATIVVHAKRGEEGRLTLEVPPFGRAAHGVRAILAAEVAAVRVDITGGQAVVEHTVSGERGRSTAPCTPRASDTWYLAAGVTAADASEMVALYNPFPDAAIVDFSFVTNEGRAQPQALTGYVVPPRGVALVDIGGHVRRRELVSTEIVARTGRLVVDRVQSFDGRVGRNGLVLSLAAPSPGLEWYFPDGQVGEGLTETFVIYNPGDEEASVDIELRLDEGQAEPFQLAVPPRGHQVVDVGADGRVPPGVAHAAVVRVLDGVPVVAERQLLASGGATRKGASITVGARRTATRWAFADGRATDSVDEWLVIHNPSSSPRSVSIFALVGGQKLPVADLQAVPVDPGRRTALRIGEHIGREELSLLVEADGAVVVERGLFAVDGIGMSATVGIPLD